MKKIEANDPAAQSADIVTDNLSHLQSLFPEAFAEGKVQFDVLRQLLGGAVDETDEKYGLNWHGKRRARQIALTPSTGTLRPCPDESVDWDTTQNLMIEGDNLEVLKLLQKSYAGKVKLIYIDPPYNTGKDFVYPDNFRDSIGNYLELTGQVEGGAKLSANTETSGRFHTDWLNMMYPRLRLARTLLRDDGVIFISIDDDEFQNLRLLCNEIYGEENIIATLVWEKGRKNDAKLVSVGHEYMLVVAKNKAYFKDAKIKWREAKPGAKEILDEYISLRKKHGSDNALVENGIRQFYESLPKTHPSKKHSRYNKVDDKGVWRDDNMSWPGGSGPTFDVIHPITKQACAVPDGGWRYSTLEKMQEMIDMGKVVFRDDHTQPPIRKTYLVEVDDLEEDESDTETEDDDDLPIQVAGSYFYRSALQASNELTKIFGKKVFNNPKDREVIARWISYVGTQQNDIVLDFFAGSGTTGHAVLEINRSTEQSLRFILVQLPEPINPKAKGSKPSIAFLEKIQRPRNIAELTKERLRRVGKAIKSDNSETMQDLGFRVYKLDSSNIRAWNPNPENLAQSLLDHHEHILDGRTEADLSYELLLKLGLDLCVPMETRTIAGKSVEAVGGGVLMLCLAEKLAAAEVEAVAAGIIAWHKELAPAGDSTVVFRDSAFDGDVAKTNMAAILAQNGLENVRSV